MVFGTHCSKIDWFSGIYGAHANEVTVMKVHIEEKIVNSQILSVFFLIMTRRMHLPVMIAAREGLHTSYVW